ncbi:MAG: MarR family transcriptional regulator [Anaeromyxobacter sp.]
MGLLIAVARRRIKQAVLARAAGHRLSPQQFWLLVGLLERPGASQRELAGALHLDAPTASRVVAALVRRRLVRVEADPADRRRVRLHLTPAGAQLAGRLAVAAAEIRETVVEGLSGAELEALRRSLRHVIANLERLEGRAVRSLP